MDQKAVSKCDPQDWMKAKETRSLMDALGRGKALFVGGCVRGALLGLSVEDIDIASVLTPDEVTRK